MRMQNDHMLSWDNLQRHARRTRIFWTTAAAGLLSYFSMVGCVSMVRRFVDGKQLMLWISIKSGRRCSVQFRLDISPLLTYAFFCYRPSILVGCMRQSVSHPHAKSAFVESAIFITYQFRGWPRSEPHIEISGIGNSKDEWKVCLFQYQPRRNLIFFPAGGASWHSCK